MFPSRVLHSHLGRAVEDGMKVIGWVCTILCLVSYTAAFSHGASLSACGDMTPKHIRAQLQNPRNNYITLHTNMSFYFPGDKVPVTVRSTRDFMGFLLQARRVSNDQVAGTFVFIPPGSKLLTCFEDGDSVTHSDKSLKRNLSFVWKAPAQPIGDIKFFLSVVQSYFVYWVRIESAIVSHQIQNRTPADSSKKSSTIMPTPLQKPTDSKVTVTASKGSATPNSITVFTQSAKFMPARLTRIAVTKVLEPAFGSRQDTEQLDKGKQQPKTSVDSVALRVSSRHGGGQANRSSIYSDQSLEPSLEFQGLDMANILRSFILQDYTSSPSTSDGSPSISGASTSQLCLTCKENIQATASLSTQLWYTYLLAVPGTTSQHRDGEADLDVSSSLSSASRQMAETRSVTQKASANFLLQSEHAVSGEEEENQEEVAGNTLPWVTRPMPDAAVPGKEAEHPRKGGQFIAAQLGILLGCTAALGMALAAGLRCIHAQYCHKRTEVSFSEPDNDVITMREGGEMMQFRKIRENSFVLVQAEYNWISPSGSGKKTVI
ncbi:reelin domain-containing protein 1 isoform X3 [Gopherus flavomarginatus]|uniref:reelin domain-containing protein 1 isoform X3 n=1 Tax=Gopherus flavomarginatus TaxID=286002 RepID=UPI0021CBF5BB|nr:reelin domain-containing protein 1 isoform X3 [Gopherus flavomarginatus]